MSKSQLKEGHMLYFSKVPYFKFCYYILILLFTPPQSLHYKVLSLNEETKACNQFLFYNLYSFSIYSEISTYVYLLGRGHRI